MDNVVAVSRGSNHTIVLQESGTLWAWGENSHYQLGDGTRVTRRTTPEIVTVIQNVLLYGAIEPPTPSPQPTPTPTPTPIPTPTPLPEINNPVSYWALEYIQRAAALELIPTTLQNPAVDLREPITRAEFAGIVVNVFEQLSGETVVHSEINPFNDTQDEYVLRVFNAGLMVGMGYPNEFAPNVLLSREQAATALTRAYKRTLFPTWTLATYTEYTLEFTWGELFADDANISYWARESVYFMAANGIIQGTGNNMFSPRAVTASQQERGYAQATREQALIIALRMIEILGDR